ncbi:hypothetical protein [Reichenbachiella sp.]|uniref:hypothetical protein n=1 Tax=Reichenbachiella sp. TaxID=2184521 RepID=UPI003BAF06D4
MRVLVFFSFFSFVSLTSYSQEQWLVTTQMDTVYGKIYLETGDKYKVDEARVKDGKTKTGYKAYQVRSVHLDENQDFETLKIDGRYQFAQVDIKAKYFSRYLYKDPELGTSSNYALKILVNWKGDQYKVSNLTSKKKFAEYFEDCESVSNKIEAGELKKKDLEKIFAEYDACLDAANSQNTIAEPISEITPTEVLQPFIEDLKSQELYNGEIITMLEDISQRMRNNQSIPNYLQQAVLSHLGENEEMKAKFLSLVEK